MKRRHFDLESENVFLDQAMCLVNDREYDLNSGFVNGAEMILFLMGGAKADV